MSDLSLTLVVDASRVLAGQRLRVRVELTNVSSRVLHVQEPYGVLAPPLTFTFRHSPDAEPLYELSRAQLDETLLGDDTPMAVEPDLVALEPAAKLETEDDLGELTLSPIAVGHYFVRAEWRQAGLPALSHFVELDILAPTLLACAPLLCEQSHEVVGLLAHQTDTGSVLFERRVMTPAPQVGSLTSRHFVPAPSVVRDVAIAAHTSDSIRGRWHAWLRDSELWAAASWGDALTAKPAPLRVGFDEPKLARPMFHTPSGRGIVIVWGRTTRGAFLQRFDLQPKQLRGGPIVDLGSVAPSRVVVRALSERGRLAVFWSENDAQSTCIRGCILDEKGRLTDGPRVHYTSPLPTLTWDVAPLGNLPDTELHLALGPDERGTVHYVIAPPSGVSAPPPPAGFQRTLPRFIPSNAVVIDGSSPDPTDPAPQWLKADAAVVSGARHLHPVLFIRCGSTLLLARADRSGWDVLRRTSPLPAEHLHLMTHGAQRWAGWYEPQSGLFYAPS